MLATQQRRLDLREIGAEVVAHHGVGGPQFQPGNQLRIDLDRKRHRPVQARCEWRGAMLQLLRTQRTRRGERERHAVCTELQANRLGELRNGVGETADEAAHAHVLRQLREQLCRDVDGELGGLDRDEFVLFDARGLGFGVGGRAQPVRIGLRGSQ